jgi:hypothetical protein
MADTKITALTAISSITPATFPLPIVDLLDTTMAGSGTTKKVTVNQILGCGGTATLASATITGDLTVDTSTLKVDSSNNRVGIGTASPTQILTIQGAANQAFLQANDSTAVYQAIYGVDSVAGGGVLGCISNHPVIFRVNNTEQMRLNSTGLGVGVTPAQKLTVLTNVGVSATTATAADDRLIFTENMASADLGSQIVWKSAGNGNAYASIGFTNGAAGNNGSLIFSTSSSIFGSNNVERMRIDSAGNLILQSSATPATLGTNGMLTVNATSNTNLRFSYRGSDGTTRVANITLA